jgi:hypothetical protein
MTVNKSVGSGPPLDTLVIPAFLADSGCAVAAMCMATGVVYGAKAIVDHVRFIKRIIRAHKSFSKAVAKNASARQQRLQKKQRA